MRPGEPLALPAVFTGFGRHDGDEPWQFHQYLTEHRLLPYEHGVTFNSNGVDSNRISTGAKDDMDLATVQQIAPLARRMGVDTFILDDGWQARSGDWQPDSPQYPEPRWDGTPGVEVQAALPGLGVQRRARRDRADEARPVDEPDVLQPVVRDLCAAPRVGVSSGRRRARGVERGRPRSGSNEAGLGAWGPAALPHVESRIREAIEGWGVRYFKFDFLVWLDCLDGPDGARDMYEFHDAFVAMLDRLRADHPEVVFQIDETNDYRLFPFESVTRGPSGSRTAGPTSRTCCTTCGT